MNVYEELSDLQIRHDLLFDALITERKKLAIAVEALKSYCDDKRYESCYKCQCAFVDGHDAQMALKEIDDITEAFNREHS
jgi:hypothetical protein